MLNGFVAGAVGGLIGTWAMSEAQRLWTHVVDGKAPESAGGRHDARDWQERSEHQNSNELAAQAVRTSRLARDGKERSEHQNSNELAAQAIARYVLGRRLTKHELRVAAPLMHYVFGASV